MGKVVKSSILTGLLKKRGEVMDNIKIAEKKIDELAEFLQHNIQLGYITSETTVDELLMLLQNIREGYLPLQKEVDRIVKNMRLKG